MRMRLNSQSQRNSDPHASGSFLNIAGVFRLLSITVYIVSIGFGRSAPLLAQQSSGVGSAETNFGVAQSDILTIDRDRLFRESLYGKRILADLEAERRRLASEASKVDAALAAEEKSLTEQRDTLKPEAFRVLADAFDDKVQSLREGRPVPEHEFTNQFEQERVAYFEKIGAILGKIVRERGGGIILDRRAILLTTENIDITDDAIARIDAQFGDEQPAKQPVLEPATPAQDQRINPPSQGPYAD